MISESDWQPIITAPKDGTRILATDGDVIAVVAWLNWNSNRRGKKIMVWAIPESWQDEQGGYEDINAVAWMPLPTVPPLSAWLEKIRNG